jgi:hypothetical protein
MIPSLAWRAKLFNRIGSRAIHWRLSAHSAKSRFPCAAPVDNLQRLTNIPLERLNFIDVRKGVSKNPDWRVSLDMRCIRAGADFSPAFAVKQQKQKIQD